MSCRRWAIFVSLVLGTLSSIHAQSPPTAKRVEYRHAWHGESILDEYYWLREKSNPEVIQYLDAENAYVEAMTRDLRAFEETIYQGDAGARQADRLVGAHASRRILLLLAHRRKAASTRVQCRRKGQHGRARGNLARPQRAGPGPRVLRVWASFP